MNWKKSVFENFKLYAVTNITTPQLNILDEIEDAYRGGADIVQLRGKNISDNSFFRLGMKAKRLGEKYQKLLFVNDRTDLAIAIAADGIHLGQDDLPLDHVHGILKRSKASMWLGKSTHSLEQAHQARMEGADYIGVGPIFKTPTKPDYPEVGLDLIRKVSSSIGIPFVAIGGIDESNIRAVLEAGANRVAVVRAIFSAPNIERATRIWASL